MRRPKFVGISLPIIALLIAMLPGCINSPASPTSSAEPPMKTDSTPGSTVPDIGPTPPEQALRDSRLNMTACAGSLAVMTLPGPLLRPHIPEKYKLYFPADSVGRLSLESNSCQKVAVNGLDVGAVSVVFVYVDVSKPPEAPPDAGLIPRYVLEVRANHTLVNDWFRAKNIPTGNGSASRNWQTVGSGYSTLEAKVLSDGRPAYELFGYVGSQVRSREDPARYYYGPNPQTDFLNQRWTQQWSNGGDGRLSMEAGTVISKIVGGLTTGHAQTQILDATTRVLSPFDDPLQ